MLPFLEGWIPVVDKQWDINVTKGAYAHVIGPGLEMGWILGATASLSNKYLEVYIKYGEADLHMSPEHLYRLGLRNPLKPSRKPYVLRYYEDSAGSETGIFVVDFDPSVWEPFIGKVEAKVYLPKLAKMPDGTTVSPSASTATLYFLGMARVVIRDKEAFTESYYEFMSSLARGRAPEVTEEVLERMSMVSQAKASIAYPSARR